MKGALVVGGGKLLADGTETEAAGVFKKGESGDPTFCELVTKGNEVVGVQLSKKTNQLQIFLNEALAWTSPESATANITRVVEMGKLLRTQLTIESNSLLQQNLIEYLIANLKPKLLEEGESQIHIPSWKLHFVSHLCS